MILYLLICLNKTIPYFKIGDFKLLIITSVKKLIIWYNISNIKIRRMNDARKISKN